MNMPIYTEVKEKRKFTAIEVAFAWISFIAAYLFCRAFPVNLHPLGGFLLIFSVYTVTAVFIKIKGGKFGVIPFFIALSAVIISASLILCDNYIIRFTAYAYACVTYCYFVYSSFGNRLKKGFSDLIFIDYFKAIFIFPFCSFTAIFKAIFASGSKKGSKALGKVMLGLMLAIIPTALALWLLSYDESFRELLKKLFDFDFLDIISHFISFNFAVPLGAFCYSTFIASTENKFNDAITQEGCSSTAKAAKIAPVTTVVAATLPILFVYIIFFISQFKYYASAFTGVLPDNFSYAEYARSGFFELCLISLINLIVIILAMSLTHCKNKGTSVVLKLTCSIFSLATLILISTAIAKMVMYIDCYGLTPKRVYATWFEIVLALIFIIIILKQIFSKLNAVISSFIVTVICFALLSLSGIGTYIAEYNVSGYINNTLTNVDIEALEELGDDAVPEMVRLYEYLSNKEELGEDDKELELELRYSLEFKKELYELREEDEDIFSITIPRLKAKTAIKKFK